MELLVHVKNVVLVAMKYDAAVRQLAEGVQMMLPFTFGIKERLMALLPKLLDDGLERLPIMRLSVETIGCAFESLFLVEFPP